jgi:hypothetical protein
MRVTVSWPDDVALIVSRLVSNKACGPRNGPPEKWPFCQVLSGPIKCESAKSLIHRLAPKIRESQNQRILSRFPIKTNIRESISATHTILSFAGRRPAKCRRFSLGF